MLKQQVKQTNEQQVKQTNKRKLWSSTHHK